MTEPLRRFVQFVALNRLYTALLWAAFAWTIVNCVYVYLVLDEPRMYRLESALIILCVLLLPRLLATAQGATRTELSTRSLRAFAVGMLVLWLASAVSFLTYPFLSDDYVFFARYHSVREVPYAPMHFRPLFALVFWFSRLAGGGSTLPFHLAGMCLHVGCAALVSVLARRLFESPTVAVLCFGVALLSPLQLEATLWISGLQELLCAFFLLAAATVYLRTDSVSLHTCLAALPLLICALLSKETAVAYVPMFPVLDMALGRIKRFRSAAAVYTVLLSLLGVYLAVRSRFALSDPRFLIPPTRYFLKQFLTLPYRFFVQPWSAGNVDVLPVVACTVSLIAISAVFVASERRRVSRRLLIGPLIVVCTSIPLYRYFFVNPDLMAARYLYLPMIGWALLVADVVTSLVRNRAVLAGVIGVMMIGYAALLQLNLRPWRTAAEVISVMRTAVLSDRDPREALWAWQSENRVLLRLRQDGVPIEYRGVSILSNGYEEFLQQVRAKSQRAP